MRSLALAAYAIVLVLFGVLIAPPYLRLQHDTPAEVPSPSPLAFTSLDVVPAGHKLCMSDVVMPKQSQRMRFRVGSYGKPGPRLRVTLTAPGYHAAVRVKPGWPDNLQHNLALPQPPHDELVTVCIADAGRTMVALYAAGDTARSRVNVTMDGKRVMFTPELAFFPARTHSIAQNASLTAARVAVFRGVLGHTWIVWTLAVLFVVAVPLLLGAALSSAVGQTR